MDEFGGHGLKGDGEEQNYDREGCLTRGTSVRQRRRPEKKSVAALECASHMILLSSRTVDEAVAVGAPQERMADPVVIGSM